jgi:hypothetical protein
MVSTRAVERRNLRRLWRPRPVQLVPVAQRTEAGHAGGWGTAMRTCLAPSAALSKAVGRIVSSLSLSLDCTAAAEREGHSR